MIQSISILGLWGLPLILMTVCSIPTIHTFNGMRVTLTGSGSRAKADPVFAPFLRHDLGCTHAGLGSDDFLEVSGCTNLKGILPQAVQITLNVCAGMLRIRTT